MSRHLTCDVCHGTKDADELSWLDVSRDRMICEECERKRWDESFQKMFDKHFPPTAPAPEKGESR